VPRGHFITLEGGEGAGKTTQLSLLCEAFAEAGIEAVPTREPGGAKGAEQIRALLVSGAVQRWDPLTEALLHFAARREHLVQTVWPALKRGATVVSDRFADSTMAYQGYGQGVDQSDLERLYQVTVGEFAPDLTIILDLPVETGLARAKGRADGGSRYERMDTTMHERLRQGFLAIARRQPTRCVVIDASAPADVVHTAIRRAVSERLGVLLHG
jgi:dTMP kinase